ncbi:MAG: plasmid pRiA4b ORF-3 family protein [Mesotoga sp.]|nr:plasmid pRiA4b ORF-3 family protein [Mesotoga sp.]
MNNAKSVIPNSFRDLVLILSAGDGGPLTDDLVLQSEASSQTQSIFSLFNTVFSVMLSPEWTEHYNRLSEHKRGAEVRKGCKLIYQFKIMLLDITPLIWRRIQVSDIYTFWDLHVAIQDAMGWSDYHLHEFQVVDPKSDELVYIGLPIEDTFKEVHDSRELRISDYLSINNRKASYLYDFGDNWIHDILLEDVLGRDLSVKYPRCIAGERACPPEDVGGTMGYRDLVEAMKNKNRPDREDLIDWLGKEYDPESFDRMQIHFDDPDERLKNTY